MSRNNAFNKAFHALFLKGTQRMLDVVPKAEYPATLLKIRYEAEVALTKNSYRIPKPKELGVTANKCRHNSHKFRQEYETCVHNIVQAELGTNVRVSSEVEEDLRGRVDAKLLAMYAQDAKAFEASVRSCMDALVHAPWVSESMLVRFSGGASFDLSVTRYSGVEAEIHKLTNDAERLDKYVVGAHRSKRRTAIENALTRMTANSGVSITRRYGVRIKPGDAEVMTHTTPRSAPAGFGAAFAAAAYVRLDESKDSGADDMVDTAIEAHVNYALLRDVVTIVTLMELCAKHYTKDSVGGGTTLAHRGVSIAVVSKPRKGPVVYLPHAATVTKVAESKGGTHVFNGRRGHWREFKSPYFKNKQGTRTFIPAIRSKTDSRIDYVVRNPR